MIHDAKSIPVLLEGAGCAGRGRRRRVEGVDLQLGPGEFLAILGPNGAGKSSLLAMMDATLRPDTGRVRLWGTDPWEMPERRRAALRARIGVVPQRSESNALIPLTAEEVVAIGRLRGRSLGSRLSREDRQAIDEAQERLGIATLAKRIYRELSGGEQQKVQMARALAQQPDLLLLDEATAGLDLRWQRELTELIAGVARTGDVAIVMTTHIIDHVPAECGRTALLSEGRMIFAGDTREALQPGRLEELYGCPVELLERHGRRHCVAIGGDAP